MRPALVWLFEHGDPPTMRQAIQDQTALSDLRTQLERALSTAGGSPVPAGDRGNNLILALIALRLKFPQEEATSKLETNLSLRRG